MNRNEEVLHDIALLSFQSALEICKTHEDAKKLSDHLIEFHFPDHCKKRESHNE